MSAENSAESQLLRQVVSKFINGQLCYRANTFKKTYSYEQTEASESPDFERLKLGLPPFARYGLGKVQYKNVVLADWSACLWSDYEIIVAQAFFKELIKQVECVFWTSIGAIYLTARHVACYKEFKRILKSMVVGAAFSCDITDIDQPIDQKLPLTRNGSYLLTYATFQPLLRRLLHGEKYKFEKSIYSTHYGELLDGQRGYLLSVHQSRPMIGSIVCNQYPANIDAGILEKNNIIIIEDVEIVRVGNRNLSVVEVLQLARKPHIKKISFQRNASINLFAVAGQRIFFRFVTEVELLGGNIVAGNIFGLLDRVPCVKILKVHGYQTIKQLPVLPQTKYAHLQVIDLSESNLCYSEVLQFIAVAPNLTSLNLKQCARIKREEIAAIHQNYAHLQIESDDDSLNDQEEGLALQIRTHIFDMEMTKKFEKNSFLRKADGLIDDVIEQKAPQPKVSPALYVLGALLYGVSKLTGHVKETQNNFLPQPVFDPVFDPAKYKQSAPEKNPFQFKDENYADEHRTLLNKFSQFFMLSGDKVSQKIVNKIQNGICSALAYYFLSMTAENWERFIIETKEWDGKKKTSQQLAKNFAELRKYVELQIHSARPTQYLGDGLEYFLNSMNPRDSYVFGNNWHAISIKKLPNHQWHIYDSNFSGSYKTFNIVGELVPVIHHSIGKCVSLDVNPTKPPLKAGVLIRDLNEFLREGGILYLVSCVNAKALMAEINILQRAADFLFSFEALEGLLLRNVNYIPAWVCGLKKPLTREFTLNLLQQLIAVNSGSAKEALLESIKEMTPAAQEEQQDVILSLLKFYTTVPSAEEEKHSHIEQKRKIWLENYQLAKWQLKKENTAVVAENIDAYMDACISPFDQNSSCFIELKIESHLHGLRFALQKKARATGHSFRYIHSPDELMQFVGEHQREKSPVFDQENDGDNLVLVINCNDFLARDFAYLQKVMTREGDGVQPVLSPSTKVFGLFNNNGGDQNSRRFHSYFKKRQIFPTLLGDQLVQHIPALPKEKSDSNVKSDAEINLFQSKYWKNYLLGRWIVSERGEFQFEPTVLSTMKSGMHVEIQNGPWDDSEFQLFWQNLSAENGKITYNEKTFDLTGVIFSRITGYEWKKIKSFFVHRSLPTNIPDQHTIVLTPHNLQKFLGGLVCEENGFCMRDGLIKDHSKGSLHVYLIRELDEHQWAMLLTACETYNVKLHVSCASGVELPEVLEPPSEEKDKGERKETQAESRFEESHIDWTKTPPFATTQIIVSTDSDVTVATLKAADPHVPWHVIPISECTASDLLERIKKRKGKNEYYLKQGALLTMLADEKQVILKGKFSPALADQLAPLLLARFNNPHTPGKLCIVTEDHTSFQYTSTVRHIVSDDEKERCLADYEVKSRISEEFEDEKLEEKPSFTEQLRLFFHKLLITLQAQLDYLKDHPGCAVSDSEKAWDDLTHLPIAPQIIDPFDPEESDEKIEAEAKAFHDRNRAQVDRGLQRGKVLFAGGLSGTGKTTFFTKKYKGPYDELLIGIKNIKKWAKTPPKIMPEGEKVPYVFLFLDEVTLMEGDLCMFEGLCHDPPGVLINGEYIELTPQHRLVLAGNPASYSEDRRIAELLKRYPNIIIFSPFSSRAMYWDVLKPLFKHTHLEVHAKKVGAIFLKVYEFLVEISVTDVLTSPRELEAMALLTIANTQPDDAIEKILEKAKYFAFTVGRPLVPKYHKENFDRFFGVKREEDDSDLNELSSTPKSRQSASLKLDEFLALRDWRLKPREVPLNETQKYGGLGGYNIKTPLVFEDRKLVLEKFKQYGFKESSFNSDMTRNSPSGKVFYQLDATLPPDKQEALLMHAFHVGHPVVMSNANSTASLESLTNALEMGRTPDGQEPPENDGFFLIKIQEPAETKEGLNADSTAVQRREYQVQLPMYTEEETCEALCNKGLSILESDALLKGFQDAVEVAQKADAILPTREELFSIADNIATAKQIAELGKATPEATMAIPNIAGNPFALVEEFPRDALQHNFHQSAPVVSSR